MDCNPLVSVIIPTYNRPRYLKRSIQSVINQKYENWELIIVDDCSDLEIENVVNSVNDQRIKYKRHNFNKGGAAARNTGIRCATGKYLAFLDDDDQWYTQKLEKQVGQLESLSDTQTQVGTYCGMTYTDTDELQPIKKKIRSLFSRDNDQGSREELIKLLLLDRTSLGAGSTLLVRRDVVDSIDGFNESFRRYQDIEFILRLLQKGELMTINKPLVYRSLGTDIPSPEVHHRSYLKLLSEFEDEVYDLQKSGYNPYRIWELKIARLYFQDSQIRQGCSILVGHPGERLLLYLQVLFGLLLGITNYIRRRI